MEAFVILFDVAVLAFAVWVARRLKTPRPNPLENWHPSDDARSGRRITLFSRPKDWRHR